MIRDTYSVSLSLNAKTDTEALAFFLESNFNIL